MSDFLNRPPKDVAELYALKLSCVMKNRGGQQESEILLDIMRLVTEFHPSCTRAEIQGILSLADSEFDQAMNLLAWYIDLPFRNRSGEYRWFHHSVGDWVLDSMPESREYSRLDRDFVAYIKRVVSAGALWTVEPRRLSDFTRSYSKSQDHMEFLEYSKEVFLRELYCNKRNWVSPIHLVIGLTVALQSRHAKYALFYSLLMVTYCDMPATRRFCEEEGHFPNVAFPKAPKWNLARFVPENAATLAMDALEEYWDQPLRISEFFWIIRRLYRIFATDFRNSRDAYEFCEYYANHWSRSDRPK